MVAVGCAPGPEGMQSSTSSLVINPDASEAESHITLQLPTDACLPGATCAKVLGAVPALFVDGDVVFLNEAKRLVPGMHNVAVNGLGWQVTTAAGQDLTVVLPIAARQCIDDPLPTVPAVDFGGRVSVVNAACPTMVTGSAVGVRGAQSRTVYFNRCAPNQVWTSYSAGASPLCDAARNPPQSTYVFVYVDTLGQCTSAGTGYRGCMAASGIVLNQPGKMSLTDVFQAYPPGTITAMVNGAAQTMTLDPGDEAYFELHLPAVGSVPPTFETDITFAEPRTNPDAVSGTITSTCVNDATYTIPPPATLGAPTTLGLHAFVNANCRYKLNVGGREQRLDQASVNSITLHRLDVNDVTVTREDHSTYTTQGTYSLNYGGERVVGPYSTGTGLDLLPGSYEFSLGFTTFDGPQTQTKTLTF